MGKHDKNEPTPQELQDKADSFDAQYAHSQSGGYPPLPETPDNTGGTVVINGDGTSELRK